MADLFGLDIAGIVNDAIEDAGGVRSGTLKKVTAGTRTGGSLASGTNPTETSHTFNGFVEMRTKRIAGQLQAQNMSVLTLLGASIVPTAEPEVNDKATLDGVEYVLLELVSEDPASAVYEFKTGA